MTRDAFMADIVAKRLVRYLERAGYVVMKRPPLGGHSAIVRGFKPTINEAMKPLANGKTVEKIIPGLEGSTNWFPPAYDPSSGILFVAVNQWGMGLTSRAFERAIAEIKPHRSRVGDLLSFVEIARRAFPVSDAAIVPVVIRRVLVGGMPLAQVAETQAPQKTGRLFKCSRSNVSLSINSPFCPSIICIRQCWRRSKCSAWTIAASLLV
jgi:hypothetical protein